MSAQDNERDALKTRVTLLSKVRQGDERGWTQFYDMYENFIYGAGRGAGLSHEESRDVVQEVMISVQTYIAQFVPDKSRGRFRTWLRKIVQSRISDQYRKKNRNPLDKVEHQPAIDESITSLTNRIPDLTAVQLDQLIDGKLEQAILTEARRRTKARVRVEDYQAYELLCVREFPARNIAAALDVSSVTVRVRAFRVRRVISAEIRQIVRRLDTLQLSDGRPSPRE